MLAMSRVFTTTYGWPLLDDLTNPHNIQEDIPPEYEATSYNPLLDFSPLNSISISSGGAPNDNNCDPMKVTKNLNHNAKERDRRKRVNELYAFLGSLLPMSTHQNVLNFFFERLKKVSIPQTVPRAFKYIPELQPELQKEVDALKWEKQNLSSYSSSSANTSQDFMRQSAICKKEPSVITSVHVLAEKQVLIQLIYPRDNMRNKKDIDLLSKVVEYFENEEGFVLLNSTAFIGSGEGMTLNTLHLQAHCDKEIEIEKLKTKLCCFHQQSDYM